MFLLPPSVILDMPTDKRKVVENYLSLSEIYTKFLGISLGNGLKKSCHTFLEKQSRLLLHVSNQIIPSPL